MEGANWCVVHWSLVVVVLAQMVSNLLIPLIIPTHTCTLCYLYPDHLPVRVRAFHSFPRLLALFLSGCCSFVLSINQSINLPRGKVEALSILLSPACCSVVVSFVVVVAQWMHVSLTYSTAASLLGHSTTPRSPS